MTTAALTRELLHARVARGVEYLDEVRPSWRSEIDVERLDLDNSCDCVLGQLYGSFRDGVDTLGLSLAVTRALGFNYEARSNLGWLTFYGHDVVSARELEVVEAGTLRDLWREVLS